MVQRIRLRASNAGDVDLIPGQRTKGASQVALMVKNLAANAGDIKETWVSSLNWEDPLEERMETHSSILVWRIPWTDEPGRPSS